MRNRYYVLGLMSIVMLSACGKSMQLTTKSAPNMAGIGKTAGKIDYVKDSLDGKLFPLSQFDITALKSDVAFLNADDAANKTRTIGSPGFVIVGEGDKEGFVKQSNLVFRAIHQVPPAAAIKHVSNLKLVLRGVRLYAEGDKPADILAKQVLCIVDTKKCAGGKQDSADKNLNNETFWKDATLTEAVLAKMDDFKIVSEADDKGVYEYTGAQAAAPAATPSEIPELEIDLQKAFGIADADIAKWIIDNSTVYDSTGNYRKFKFELENNLYAKEGELVFQFDLNEAVKLPENFNTVAGTPVNGATDVNQDSDLGGTNKADFQSAKVKGKLDETALGFESNASDKLTAASLEKLKALSLSLIKGQDSINKIHIVAHMDIGTDAASNAKLAPLRAKAVKDALINLGVKSEIGVGSKIATTSGCAPTLDCAADRRIDLRVSLLKELATDKVDAVSKELDQSLKQVFSLKE